ncbi:U-box domain-containing protein 27-like [Vitis riparia]|uniref:U-box domain-containing protein 27-like n=1 Tax=Vitis riparia TaxID=96939 RepID=UPI00155AD700|nr:U-box domain-containing protein 27-like [Vitis riparia]
MVRNDLFINIPSFFKCPISLDVMKSPVSLCTGVTYDRSSIQTWLDNGNNTCPATMQILPSKDFVPNHTLQRLIQVWAQSSAVPSPVVSSRQVGAWVADIENRRFGALPKILDYASSSDENRRFVASLDGFVPVVAGVLGNAGAGIEILELVVRILDLVMVEKGVKEQIQGLILKSNRDHLSAILLILEKGSSDSKIASARILEAIAIDPESKRSISEREGLLSVLLQLLSSQTDSSSLDSVLSCLIAITVTRQTKTQLVRSGLVQTLAKTLSTSNYPISTTEKSIKLLSTISNCRDGHQAICEDPICVAAVVQRMSMKLSSSAAEDAVTVLWSVCYLNRDSKAQEAVAKSTGLTKILLLMQTNCSANVRRMCCDLVKIFRVNSKSCLASYDTKTTHITPY